MIHGGKFYYSLCTQFYQICDELTIVSSAGSPVFAGFITGLIMGDMGTGLFIGASLQFGSTRCWYIRWCISY